MMEEMWKDIPDYEGFYQVSNMGRVKNVKNDYIKSPVKSPKGYLVTSLWKNGKDKNCRINRLVAMAFIPIPERLKDYDLNELDVHHKDEVRTNNNVDNLEWLTKEEHSYEGNRIQRAIAATRAKQSKPVEAYDDNGNVIYRFPSTCEAGRNGFNQGHVAACCRGVEKRYKGLQWHYVTN